MRSFITKVTSLWMGKLKRLSPEGYGPKSEVGFFPCSRRGYVRGQCFRWVATEAWALSLISELGAAVLEYSLYLDVLLVLMQFTQTAANVYQIHPVRIFQDKGLEACSGRPRECRQEHY